MNTAVKPFWNHIAVIDSPVDQDETASGIVLPLTPEGGDDLVRAIIVAVGPLWSALAPEHFDELIVEGATVYYSRTQGTKVRDVTLLRFIDLIGYEEEQH